MSIVRANYWQSTNGQLRSTVLQTVSTYSNTKTSWSAVNTWLEPSTDYRVIITPSFLNSLIVVNYYIPINIYWSGASNCEHVVRAFRSVGGVKAYNLSSAGGALGSRFAIAGHAFRPPGYDLNDGQTENLIVSDLPGTTAPVTYGFEMLQENSNVPTNYMGYSASDNGTWGWSSRIVIVAQEIAQ